MASGRSYVAGQSDKSRVINVYDGSVNNLVHSYKKIDSEQEAKDAFTRVRSYIAVLDPDILNVEERKAKKLEAATTHQQEHTLVASNEKMKKVAELLQTLLDDDVNDAQAEGNSANKVVPINDSFGGLKIPGLEAEAARPQFSVVFDLGDAGKFTTAYHWINVHDGKLHLIYDTRFQYGTLYVPPSNNRKMVVSIPDYNKTYEVRSPDNVLPFGVFHIISMPICSNQESAIPEYANTAEMAAAMTSPIMGDAGPEEDEGSFESALGGEIDLLRHSVLRYDR